MDRLYNFFCFPLLLLGLIFVSNGFVGFVEIKTDKGHDSFLLDVPDFLSTIKNYLNTTYSNINERRI